ncbi:MAG: DUF6504 family protein [Nocardioides sp.]
MRRYDDPVEVRRGWVEGPGRQAVGGPAARVEGPEQFLWHGRLWKVRAVLAHWVETGPWWQAPGVQAVIGTDDPRPEPPRQAGGDLLVERELWRVEAGRGGGHDQDGDQDAGGIFDLAFDWSGGHWQLVGCVD